MKNFEQKKYWSPESFDYYIDYITVMDDKQTVLLVTKGASFFFFDFKGNQLDQSSVSFQDYFLFTPDSFGSISMLSL